MGAYYCNFTSKWSSLINYQYKQQRYIKFLSEFSCHRKPVLFDHGQVVPFVEEIFHIITLLYLQISMKEVASLRGVCVTRQTAPGVTPCDGACANGHVTQISVKWRSVP